MQKKRFSWICQTRETSDASRGSPCVEDALGEPLGVLSRSGATLAVAPWHLASEHGERSAAALAAVHGISPQTTQSFEPSSGSTQKYIHEMRITISFLRLSTSGCRGVKPFLRATS